MGTSPQSDLLLCVLIKPGWTSMAPSHPQKERFIHPVTGGGEEGGCQVLSGTNQGGLMCDLK